nr:MAG TPA: hypothetical protein [Caudoviricetes sp.]
MNAERIERVCNGNKYVAFLKKWYLKWFFLSYY